MGAMASQITNLTIVYTTIYSGTDQRKHQKLPVTGLCAGNSPVTGDFPAQMASNAENVSIWWRHREELIPDGTVWSPTLHVLYLLPERYCKPPLECLQWIELNYMQLDPTIYLFLLPVVLTSLSQSHHNTHILQNCFTSTGAIIVRLSLCQWSNHDFKT